jgi:hypothetical protein
MKAEAPVVAEPEEMPAEPADDKSVEAAPPVEAKKKTTKPRAKRTKAAASAEAEEKTAKSTGDVINEAESAITEEEDKDVTTEKGEIPQDS